MKRFLEWMFWGDNLDWRHDVVIGVFGALCIFAAMLAIMGFFALIFWILDQIAP